MSKPGFYKGKHYTEYVDRVKALKRVGDLDKVEKLLLGLVNAVEREARLEHYSVAPWYYEQLAIVYRKHKNYRAEIAILERYAKGCSRGKKVRLMERLDKARNLLQSE